MSILLSKICNFCKKIAANESINQECKICRIAFYCPGGECAKKDAKSHSNYCKSYTNDQVKSLLQTKQGLNDFSADASEMLRIWKEVMDEEFPTKGRGVIKIQSVKESGNDRGEEERQENNRENRENRDKRERKKNQDEKSTAIKTEQKYIWTYMPFTHEILDRPSFSQLKYFIENYDPQTQLVLCFFNFDNDQNENNFGPDYTFIKLSKVIDIFD